MSAALTRESVRQDARRQPGVGNELAIFGNALREFLGMEPLYTENRLRKPPTDAERFHVAAYALPQALPARRHA